jgi:predicted Kef-type K+ transport protein
LEICGLVLGLLVGDVGHGTLAARVRVDELTSYLVIGVEFNFNTFGFTR